MSTVSFDRRSLFAALAGTFVSLWVGNLSAQENLSDDDRLANSDVPAGNLQLQAIGSLGVGQIQSTLGLIGVIADSITKNIYTHKQIEDLMNGTISGLDSPMKMLRRLQDSNISGEDAEFLDRMISVLRALQQEARALTAYSKSHSADDAGKYEKERRRVLKKLGELTQQDDLFQSDSTPKRVPNLK